MTDKNADPALAFSVGVRVFSVYFNVVGRIAKKMMKVIVGIVFLVPNIAERILHKFVTVVVPVVNFRDVNPLSDIHSGKGKRTSKVFSVNFATFEVNSTNGVFNKF